MFQPLIRNPDFFCVNLGLDDMVTASVKIDCTRAVHEYQPPKESTVPSGKRRPRQADNSPTFDNADARHGQAHEAPEELVSRLGKQFQPDRHN